MKLPKRKRRPAPRGRDLVVWGAAVLVGALCLATIVLVIQSAVTGRGGGETLAGVVLNAMVAALGFAAICASIRSDREIKRFEYVADYNFNFLSNPELSRVERMLESCNQEYERLSAECGGEWGDGQAVEFVRFCDTVFGSQSFAFSDDPGAPNTRRDGLNWISEEYQGMVNYLVYLESFVPLLTKGQVGFGEVDDLFGYRYFIAVNNPVLQENELCRERQYYRGIFEAYGPWRDYRDGDIPMKEYDLTAAWEAFKLGHPEAAE